MGMLTNNLNKQQRRAAEYRGKHLLVLAGAGTGKTRTIIARAEYLIRHGVSANRIAILSFTRKSAQEIAHRVKIAVAEGYNSTREASTASFNEGAGILAKTTSSPQSQPQTAPSSTRKKPPTISGRTFHSWCNEIIQRYPDYFPQSGYTLLDDDDQRSALGLVLGRKMEDSQGKRIKSDSVLRIYSYAVNTLCSLSEAIKKIRYEHVFLNEKALAEAVQKDRALIAPVIKQYIEYKKARQYVDYDDLLSVVAHGLERNEVIRREVAGRWDHILVDEMQDTNPLQYKLLKSFTEGCRLFCVGDDAQSIYAFRGADFKTIHSFTELFPDSETYKLEVNYRSTQEILDLSNWLLDVSPLRYNKRLVAHRGSGLMPELVYTFNEWEEADEITGDVLASVEGGARLSDSMVLGRSAWALSKVEGACLQKKIPYRKLGGTSLMKTAHVRDVVSALRVLVNPFDEIAWIRYLKLWPGIGDVKAARIISGLMEGVGFDGLSGADSGGADSGGAVLDDADLGGSDSGANVSDESSAVQSHARGNYTIETIVPYLRNNPHLQTLPSVAESLRLAARFTTQPSRAIRAALDSMENTLIKIYDEEWHYRKDDFLVLEEVAKSTGSLSEFITEYVLDPSVETTLKIGAAPDDDVLTLSTIHSAKGLEASNVHIVGVNPFSYPSTRTIKEGMDSVEEERRCLYVALTRAKDVLKIYRNLKSLHAQPVGEKSFVRDDAGADADAGADTPKPIDELIHNRKLYRSRRDESNEVTVQRITNQYVEVFHTKRRSIERIAYNEFLDDYEEVIETAEELYFLNHLPPDLARITVPGDDHFQAEQNLPRTTPADFPDFDFN